MPSLYYANPCHIGSVTKPLTKRAHVLAEVVREEIQRRRQREALRAAAGSWKDKDHPELKGGSAAWVRKMRAESETRFRRIQQHRDRG